MPPFGYLTIRGYPLPNAEPVRGAASPLPDPVPGSYSSSFDEKVRGKMQGPTSSDETLLKTPKARIKGLPATNRRRHSRGRSPHLRHKSEPLIAVSSALRHSHRSGSDWDGDYDDVTRDLAAFAFDSEDEAADGAYNEYRENAFDPKHMIQWNQHFGQNVTDLRTEVFDQDADGGQRRTPTISPLTARHKAPPSPSSIDGDLFSDVDDHTVYAGRPPFYRRSSAASSATSSASLASTSPRSGRPPSLGFSRRPSATSGSSPTLIASPTLKAVHNKTSLPKTSGAATRNLTPLQRRRSSGASKGISPEHHNVRQRQHHQRHCRRESSNSVSSIESLPLPWLPLYQMRYSECPQLSADAPNVGAPLDSYCHGEDETTHQNASRLMRSMSTCSLPKVVKQNVEGALFTQLPDATQRHGPPPCKRPYTANETLSRQRAQSDPRAIMLNLSGFKI
ncbi:unnamed protein product [Jaminaea pallidilutea]